MRAPRSLSLRRLSVLPADAELRRKVQPVICYEVDKLPAIDVAFYERARSSLRKIDQVVVPPRDGCEEVASRYHHRATTRRTFEVPAGHLFRITCSEGPQVGDLNLWNLENIGDQSRCLWDGQPFIADEKFYASKTRQLQATHLTTYDRLWSGMPYIRPIATITHDSLAWYRGDEFGAGVHDVIGSRCDPYTNAVLRNGAEFDHCCHSNLSRALSTARPFVVTLGESLSHDPVAAARQAEPFVHDVMNVFMCTGFDRANRKYFMKSTPARKGDFIEFFAEIPLLGALSACPGGDCGSSHSDDSTRCYPLLVEIFEGSAVITEEWKGPPSVSTYSRMHGLTGRRLPPLA